MKNSATETTTLPGRVARGAARCSTRDLRRRGAAERTRRAYGIDLGQLAGWCAARGLDPAQVDYKTLRRYAAHLSERQVAPKTVARKLAAARQFFASLVEHGQMGANPADLMPLAAHGPAAAQGAQRHGRRRAARPHPHDDAARAARPRALRDRLRLRPARGGARHARRRLGRLRRRAAARRGQGRQDARSSRRASPRCAPCAATSSAAGPRWRPTRSPRCSSPRPAGGCPPPTSGAACGSWARHARSRPGRRRAPARAPALVRHPSAGGRRRPAHRSRNCSATQPSRRPRSTLA